MSVVEWSSVLGNIGDFLGSIGVIVSLVYLAVQIRQNTRSILSHAFGQKTDSEAVAHLIHSYPCFPSLTLLHLQQRK